MNEQARRSSPPNRVRSPTDQQFALGCSPPRFAATQLPSATEFVAYSDTDFHRADAAPSRAHSFRRTPESRFFFVFSCTPTLTCLRQVGQRDVENCDLLNFPLSALDTRRRFPLTQARHPRNEPCWSLHKFAPNGRLDRCSTTRRRGSPRFPTVVLAPRR